MENIPLQELHDRAEHIQSSNSPLPCFEDALADVLVNWFRDDFFVWADRKTEKCPSCRGPTEFRGSPTPTERE
jgi:peptide-N4-(N-acetyl-beta-glucosaminyl)asparagine amidase